MTRKSEPTAEGKARKAKKNAPATSAPPAGQPVLGIELATPTDKTKGAVIAELRMSPFIRHGTVASCMAAPTVTFDGPVRPLEASGALKDIADKVATGDLRHVSDTLLSQSVVLDTTMTELMRRAWLNAAEYPEAFNRYMTLALKAQAQSRTTLEALAKLHQPREQIVRHVHVYEGGQAMVAEQLHVHGPGFEEMQDKTINAKQPQPTVLASAPRCLARTRSGKACQSPAVQGKRRCRMHGGNNPGAPRGNQNAYKHGLRSNEMRRLREMLTSFR